MTARPLRLALAVLACLSAACTNPAVVGDEKRACQVMDDCPEEAPHCESETNQCFQCLDESHCLGAAPVCSDGVCRCQNDSECAEGLFCDGEQCATETESE